MRSSSSILPEKPSPSSFPPANNSHESGFKKSNVYQLLAQREVCPRKKRTPRRFWSEVRNESAKDTSQELRSWAEAESLLNLSAKDCPLVPPPRSTIAAAFSPDGSRLASTHGDHTVKINDSQTGKCLKVLSGHRRTPWVVRFHPLHPEIVASGSLDNEVRLWDTKTADCIGSRDFYRPIASMAFHAQGEILAVASGHKLYTWHYNRRGEDSSPTIILKTRRSLRAVQFHPHAAPFLLTTEVSDVDSPDSPSMTLATSHGYSQSVPSPTIYLADAHSMYGSNHSTNELPVISARLFPIWLSMGAQGHQSEAAASMAAAAELPCTVKLRIWSHDVSNPCALLDAQRCRLTIPHVVLCSEMGAHFSPCGRFLAACVACVLPNIDDADTAGHDFRASTSPTRHPLSSHQVMYELRIYSIEEATFGMVLASRAIRAAHCLTSIQFSPTSEHLLLAYGRRHNSLLNSVMVDGDTTIPIYTILEMYRVSDMECVRAVTSAEDEVNVACFHPSVGGGLVYGTKEGKLSILQCNISQSFNGDPSDNMLA